MKRLTRAATAAVLLGITVTTVSKGPAGASAATAAMPKPDHVVIVVLENKPYDAVIGDPRTPWLTSLAKRQANLAGFYGETHPSQPNYLALFSGSTQGVTDNNCPHDLGVRPNLARQLIDAGYTFTGYAEGLPAPGYRGCGTGQYVRRHVPWLDFANIPRASQQPYNAFPKDYRTLPTLSFVAPDLCHDMHDCPKAEGDRWLRTQFAGYVSWAAGHNSLFIVTFDEDNKTDGNHIPTIVAGAHVRPGAYRTRMDHYDLLRTLQDMYHLPALGFAAKRPGLRAVFD